MRWMVVNTETHNLVGGPYLWDGEAEWTPPDEGTLMLESDALAQGFTWPVVEQPPEDPPAEEPT